MLGGGGSVANMGLVLLCRRGYIFTPWNCVTCRNVWADVMCDMG